MRKAFYSVNEYFHEICSLGHPDLIYRQMGIICHDHNNMYDKVLYFINLA